MSKRRSKNPMQYRVRFASGVARYFRKRESAEIYFKEIKESRPDQVVIFEDLFANTIIDDYCPDISKVVEDNVTCNLYGSQRCPGDEEARSKCDRLVSGYISDEPGYEFGYTRDVPFTVTNNTSDSTLYTYHYKEGKLTREEVTDSKKLTLKDKLRKIFRKGK